MKNVWTKYSQEKFILEPSVKVEPEDVSFKPYKTTDVFLKLTSLRNDSLMLEAKLEIEEPKDEKQDKRSKTIGENMGIWNAEEHDLFLKGYKKYGRNWSLISKEYVTTRTRQQVRSHAQKFFRKNQLEPEDIE